MTVYDYKIKFEMKPKDKYENKYHTRVEKK